MDFTPEDIDRVGRFWQAPNMAQQPGMKAVDLFEAVRDGRIKALWIMATNPVVSLPESNRIAAALKKCPFVVVSDVVSHTDTSIYADVKLPAAAWGEKEGTVTNSERRISRQRAFMPAPGEVRPDWWIVDAVARRMGAHTAAGAGVRIVGPEVGYEVVRSDVRGQMIRRSDGVSFETSMLGGYNVHPLIELLDDAVVGAVAGGVVGNEVEKNNNRGPWYEVFVALDDGRRVVTRQRELGPLRDGSRVIVRSGRAEAL
jgi:anaerobic selenocysteine-containing dehydrogenase